MKIDTIVDEDNVTDKTVTIVGLGSVGSALADTLTRAGVNVRIIDKGRIHEGDLCTLTLYRPEKESKFKAKEGKKHLEAINPDTDVKSFHEKLTEDNTYLLDADVVVDCSQDPDTSALINDYCTDNKSPLILARVAGTQAFVHAGMGYGDDVRDEADTFGNVMDDGLLPATVHRAVAEALTKLFKIFDGEAKVETNMIDVWE
jgi:molybdopterin/thiamine biosynthesis adenylyltransferase